MATYSNPIVVSGDGPTDGAVPTWDAAEGVFTFQIPGSGGFPTDIGTIDWYVQAGGDNGLITLATAPNPLAGPEGLSAHAPDYASGAYVGFTAGAGEGFQVLGSSDRLTSGLWDGIDLLGTLVVCSLDGSQIMVASVDGFFPESGTDPTALVMSQESVVGSDLSITGGNTVTSAAGGLFNLSLNAYVEWD